MSQENQSALPILNVDRFRSDNGLYKAEDGCEFDTPEDFIHIGLLGFCGCGDPDASLEYVRAVLRHVENLRTQVWTKIRTWDQWNEDGKKLFASEGAEYFTYYLLDTKKLTEHGGSVPGWLSDDGIKLLQDLDTLAASSKKEET